MHPPVCVALASAFAATAWAVPPTPEYRDNPRPVKIAWDDPRFAAVSLEFFRARPARVTVRLEPGKGRNPTLWAKAEGEALPGLKKVHGTFARFGRTRARGLGLYWSREDYAGVTYWPRPAPEPETLMRLAHEVDAAYRRPVETRWRDLLARWPAGSFLRARLAGRPAQIEVFAGGPEAARKAADGFLRRYLGVGSGWAPLRGLHSPAFAAESDRDAGALLIAGPVLVRTWGEKPEATLREVAAMIRRPLPPAPEVGATPRAEGP